VLNEWIVDPRIDGIGVVYIDDGCTSLFDGIDGFISVKKSCTPLKIGIDGMERRNE